MRTNIKKVISNKIKKILCVSIIGTMSLSMVACGNKNETSTKESNVGSIETEQASTSNETSVDNVDLDGDGVADVSTEEIIIGPDGTPISNNGTTENIDSEIYGDLTESELNSTEEYDVVGGEFWNMNANILFIKDIEMEIPNGMEYYSTHGETVAFANKDRTEILVVYVDDDNFNQEAGVINAYENQMKSTFDKCKRNTTYNKDDITFNLYDCVKGDSNIKVGLMCQDEHLIYVEYTSINEIDDYALINILETIQYN